METLNVLIRVAAIAGVLSVMLLFWKSLIVSFAGQRKLKSIFFRLNIGLLLAQAAVVLLANNPDWHEVKFNFLLIALSAIGQQFGLWEQREKLADLIAEYGRCVSFEVLQIKDGWVVGVVNVQGIPIEAYAVDSGKFQEGKVYDDLDLFLEFDRYGHPTLLRIIN